MIRLTVFLCAGLFVVLLIAGEDKGQVRQGLMAPVEVADAPAPVVRQPPAPATEPVATVTEAVFVPAQPVRVQPESPVPVVTQRQPAAPETVAPETVAAEIAASEIADRFAVVTAQSANVRSGPSTGNAVIGRLVAGEEVLVVLEENATAGWSLVRIEGDGIEGYVASRLLQPVTP